jgi:transcriptional regulator with PAS, ATPase and Fis domain
VRELKNIVERVFVMSSENKMTFEDLPKNIVARNKNRELILGNDIIPLKDAVAKVEMELLDKAFEKYGNVRSAAKVLGIDASTFVRKRKKYRKMH